MEKKFIDVFPIKYSQSPRTIIHIENIFISMNLKKIIREEIDDMDWIREIPVGFELKQSHQYIIDCCETGYDENEFLNKFKELFGRIDPLAKVIEVNLPPKRIINWFDNRYIQITNYKVGLLLTIPIKENIDTYTEIGGWLPCEEERQHPLKDWSESYIRITPQDFLNGVIYWDIKT